MTFFGLAILIQFCLINDMSDCKNTTFVFVNDRFMKEQECDKAIETIKRLMKENKGDYKIKKYECATHNSIIIMPDHLKIEKIK